LNGSGCGQGAVNWVICPDATDSVTQLDIDLRDQPDTFQLTAVLVSTRVNSGDDDDTLIDDGSLGPAIYQGARESTP
jgi:hypothetical protein